LINENDSAILPKLPREKRAWRVEMPQMRHEIDARRFSAVSALIWLKKAFSF
jgi:hypothetical protein